MSFVLAAALLYLVGFPVAYVVTGRITTGLLVAPLAATLIGAASGIAVTAVGGSITLWFAVLSVAALAGAWVAVGRPRSLSGLAERTRGRGVAGLDGADAIVLLVPLVLPALFALSPPIEWDARSIWFFHATWFWSGSGPLHQAMANPAFGFAHADYPPLMPATIAALWHATHARSLELAQGISALVSVSAIATTGFVVRNLVRSVSPWWARVTGLGVAMSAWLLVPGGPAVGTVDHLWAACLVPAALLLLGRVWPGRDPSRRLPDGFALALLLATAAALTKNEGLVTVVFLAALASIRLRRTPRVALACWIPVVAGGVWVIVARHAGAVSDLSSSPTVHQLLSRNFEALSRTGPVAEALWQFDGRYVLASAVVSVLGVALLRRRREAAGLAPVGWLWVLAALYTASLVATYVVSPWDIAWHIATSIERVSVVLMVLLSAINGTWILTALPRRTGRPRTAAVVESLASTEPVPADDVAVDDDAVAAR